MEVIMKGYEYQSDFAKKYVAQGRAEGVARSVLAVLRARGIAVPEAVRDRILAEKEPERLERWLEKAMVASSAATIIDEPN
jgi:post-segregation antitoxin (ccd killing protein)